MKHSRLLILLGVTIVIAAGVLAYFVVRVNAQGDIISDLTKRLAAQGIPLKSIESQSLIPLKLEITLQRIDEKDKPLEAFYVHAVKREVTLARERGFGVAELTLVILDTEGNVEYWVAEPIKNISRESTAPSALDNDTAAISIAKNLDLYGLTLDTIEVVSDDKNTQTASLVLRAQDVDAGNKALPEFMPSLRPVLENLNESTGAKIKVFKMELFNDKDELLLRYVLDLELEQETWWMADGVSMEWFPHPPPESSNP